MCMLSCAHTQVPVLLCVCVLGPLKVFLPSFGKRPLVCGVWMFWGFHFPNPFNVSVFYLLLHSGLGKSPLHNIRGLSHSGNGKRFWYWPSWRSHRVTSFLPQSGQSDLEKRRRAPVASPAAGKQAEAAGLPPQPLRVSGPVQKVRSSFWILSPEDGLKQLVVLRNNADKMELFLHLNQNSFNSTWNTDSGWGSGDSVTVYKLSGDLLCPGGGMFCCTKVSCNEPRAILSYSCS